MNGAIGYGLQMDDGEMVPMAYIGCVAIPVTFAAAEKVRVDEKNCITWIVAGYEGAIRIGDAINPFHNKRGFSLNETVGCFAVAIAAGEDPRAQYAANARCYRFCCHGGCRGRAVPYRRPNEQVSQHWPWCIRRDLSSSS